MMKKLFISFVFLFAVAGANAQQDPMVKDLTALRDDYIQKIKAAGFEPSLPAPQIVLDNPPSFGNYDEHNIIHMSDWATLPAEDKAAFKAGQTI